MAIDNDITKGDGTGGVLAMMEKAFNAVTKKFQRITLMAGDTLSVSTISQGTAAAVAVAASASRVYVQVTAVDGDLYIGKAAGDLGADVTRRKVRAGQSWESYTYAGDIAIKAVTGTVTVELEQVT